MESYCQVVLLLMAVAVSMAASSTAAGAAVGPTGALRVDLTHVDASGNFSKLELLQRAARRSHHRMSALVARWSKVQSKTGGRLGSSSVLAAAAKGSQVAVHVGSGEFLMDLAVGTPAVSYSAIVDTGSDLIWTQCKHCVECFSQPTPIFDPTGSSTYATVPCSSALCKALPVSDCKSGVGCEYAYSYGDSSSTQGVLASDTFKLGSATDAGVVFGCGTDNEGDGFSQGAGIVGLGRGPLSLVSQLGFAQFSYCLTSLDSSKKSPLVLGSSPDFSAAATAGGGSAAQTTPLVQNPTNPSFYYVTLKGVSVGGTKVAIPASTFALQDDGSGGVIVDSGTSITYLQVEGYRQVKKAFISQLQLPVADGSATVGLDLCFQAPSSTSALEVPSLTFHFDGGADLDLPAENYMVGDDTSGLVCLAVMPSQGLSIIGNFQQQNYLLGYDLGQGTLSFAPTPCDQL